MISRALTRLLTLTAAAATAVALSAGTASAATPVAVAPTSTTFVAPTVKGDFCTGIPCLRLTRAETKDVADSSIGNVTGILTPFCTLVPFPPAAVACGAGISLHAADYKWTAGRAVTAGKCLVIAFPPDFTWTTVGWGWQGNCEE